MIELFVKMIGFKKCGRLSFGFKVDILVFDEIQVEVMVNYENLYQLVKGFNDIIVNGKFV